MTDLAVAFGVFSSFGILKIISTSQIFVVRLLGLGCDRASACICVCWDHSVDVSIDVWIWNVRTWTNDSVVVHSVYFKRTRKQEQIIKAIHAYVLVFSFIVIVFTCLKPKRRQTKTMTAMATKSNSLMLTLKYIIHLVERKPKQNTWQKHSFQFFLLLLKKKNLNSGFFCHTLSLFSIQ